jgi:hypothetical protein
MHSDKSLVSHTTENIRIPSESYCEMQQVPYSLQSLTHDAVMSILVSMKRRKEVRIDDN